MYAAIIFSAFSSSIGSVVFESEEVNSVLNRQQTTLHWCLAVEEHYVYVAGSSL